MKAWGFSLWALLGAALFGLLASADHQPWTEKHEAGRCAMRGNCGKPSVFSKEVPCPDNGLAEEPDDDLRKQLIDVCGDKWNEGPICCAADQVEDLRRNLATVDNFLGTCPACRANFYNLFCTFTCSPDQSLFLNVTDMAEKSDKYLTKEVDNLWSDEYGTVLYDSCKDVKYGPANAKAMTLIGGGAKNFTQWFTFLGKQGFGRSPFQINFPRPEGGEFKGMKFEDDKTYPCNSTNPNYRCSCMDCESSCPEETPLVQSEACHVGLLPCLSFAVILVYSLLLALLVTAITGHVAYRKRQQNKQERMRLLQDTSLSDDEDGDGDYIHQNGMSSRPTRRYWPNTLCDAIFSRLGRTCARFPAIIIVTSIVVVGLLSLGWLRFEVETDPVRLWVSPDSAAAREKAYFDENFGPFFRAEQAFLVNDTNADRSGGVLSATTLEWWSEVEKRVQKMKSASGNYTLADVCYNPTEQACVVQSVLRYWDAKPGFDPKQWEDKLAFCTDTPGDSECLPTFGAPLNAKNILGGYNESVLDAEAMVTTWVVNNYQEGTSKIGRAMEWENSLKTLMFTVQEEAQERGLRLSFNTEISLEQELSSSTNTDAKIVVVSYIIMFIYASLALGSTTLSVKHILRNPATALVQSKFMLGVAGIVIVLLSVSASVGLFSAAGIKVTLIIAEVIPFLVLAVGVDNIFLIVHEFERVNTTHPDSPIEERMAKALGRMGPSILLSATMETVAFALGAAVGMPAVRNFAAYAAGAVLINALLQVTMFASVLALNQRRVEANRVDCFPCVQVGRPTNVFDSNTLYASAEEDGIQRFIRRTYAPALLGKKTKATIATVFLGLFVAGLALLPYVQLGLDQRIALPSDSYMIDYFNDLAQYFEAGPPVYFVTRNLNLTEQPNQRGVCGRFSTCHQHSLTSLIEIERKRPELSYIADPAASWVDDFFIWLNPVSNKDCCVDPKTGKPCFADRQPPWNLTLSGMPEGEEFVMYLERFLDSMPGLECPYGGKAPYKDAVVFGNKPPSTPATHFRTSHTALRSQQDFISSYASARRIAADFSRETGIEDAVFPYSKHYVFFDQYATIVPLTLKLLGSALAVCFIISALLLGSIRTALVVTITVLMILVDIGGAMAVAGVSLNALTLVNLVICVGIGVEFCAHIARAFQFPPSRLLDRSGLPSAPVAAAPAGFRAANDAPKLSVGDGPGSGAGLLRGRDARVWAALSQVGGSVLSGITITKLLGVAVLAFTRSKIFEIYYFRVWLALVIFAAAHALIWLPVALSWFGGPDGK